jgi:hypothetical protein
VGVVHRDLKSDGRRAGQALLLGILLPLLILGLHPTAHDLAADAGARMAAVNRVVHGTAIASLPLLFFGVAGLARHLRWSAAATLGLVVYGFSVIGNLVAALMSGFVAPVVIERLQAVDPAAAVVDRALLHYTGELNLAFAKMAVLTAGVAILLWAFEIARGRRLTRATAVVGGGVGLALTLGIVAGILYLDVRGVILATGLQAVWLVMVAIQLVRPSGHSIDGET